MEAATSLGEDLDKDSQMKGTSMHRTTTLNLRRRRERAAPLRGALLALAAVALAMLVVSPSAFAIQSVQKFSAKVSPSRAGTKSKPQAVSISANPYFDTIAPDLDRQVQFATVNATLYFPKAGVYNGKYFKYCSPATVFQDETNCPKGSRVGTADGRGLGLGLDEAVKGQFFNIKGGKGATLLVTGESPLIIREIVPATLTKLSGDKDFSYKLSFSVPRNLQSPAPGVIAAVMKFNSKIPKQYVTRTKTKTKKVKGKKRKVKVKTKIPLIASTSCPKGGWKFKYVADYTTTFDSAIESTQTVEGSVPCKSAKKAKKSKKSKKSSKR